MKAGKVDLSLIEHSVLDLFATPLYNSRFNNLKNIAGPNEITGFYKERALKLSQNYFDLRFYGINHTNTNR